MASRKLMYRVGDYFLPLPFDAENNKFPALANDILDQDSGR